MAKPVPPFTDRDAVLGQFMDAWSRLENKAFHLFRVLSETNYFVAQAIFSTGFRPKSLTDLLITLSLFYLQVSDEQELKRLCNRYEKAAIKRNRIVHGRWAWETHDNDKLTSQWVRLGAPYNPRIMKDIHFPENQKVRSAYRFTIPQLIKTIADVTKLCEDFDRLINSIKKRHQGAD